MSDLSALVDEENARDLSCLLLYATGPHPHAWRVWQLLDWLADKRRSWTLPWRDVVDYWRRTGYTSGPVDDDSLDRAYERLALLLSTYQVTLTRSGPGLEPGDCKVEGAEWAWEVLTMLSVDYSAERVRAEDWGEAQRGQMRLPFRRRGVAA